MSKLICYGCGAPRNLQHTKCSFCLTPYPVTEPKVIEKVVERIVQVPVLNTVSTKDNSAMAVLCLFLGVFGVHRFYAGKIGTGLLQLCLTLSVMFLIISAIWAFIDLVMILCCSFRDGDGLRINKW